MKKIIIWIFIFFWIIHSSFAVNIDINNFTLSNSYTAAVWNHWEMSEDWTLFFSNESWITTYTLTTPFDTSTKVFLRNTPWIYSAIWFGISDDWQYLVHCTSTSGGNIQIWTMTTPFDTSTASVTSSIANSVFGWAFLASPDFDENWTRIYAMNTISNLRYTFQTDLSVPYDITSYSNIVNIRFDNYSWPQFTEDGTSYFAWQNTTVTQFNVPTPHSIVWGSVVWTLTVPTYLYQYYLVDSDTKFINIQNAWWTQIYNTNYSAWPPDLAFTSTWTIVPIQNGFTLSWSIINVDYKITNIDIYEYIAWTPIETDSDNRIVNITWSGGVEVSLDILSDLDFTFDAFQDYEIKITFKTIDELQTIFNWFTYGDYIYNEWYSEPVIEDFSFLVSWYTFFENWFSLNNFIPDPSWWKLYFDIKAPVEWWTGTIDIVTDFVLNSEIDGNWYWIDTQVMVTYPYHQIAWIYQVRTVYEYDDLIIYPFWEEYNSYEITVSESPSDWDIEDAEFIELDFFDSIKNFFFWIKDFFRWIMNIGKVESKNFWFFFIPQANADSVMNDIQFKVYDSEENVLSDFKDFLNWFIIFAFFLLSVILIIVINKKE